MQTMLPIAEGLLFLVGDEGITEELMAKSLEISEEEAHQLLDELQKKYQDDSFGVEVVCY
ncbi:MAG: SMC-Scp complex subunit ScpB, partial [Erysipelotrichaceae bacterium]|nr:SMC-Scp complex subunit ScpB [Erysipelotrichaceae bacterium]